VISVVTAGSEKGYTSLSALNGSGALATTLAAWGTDRVGLGALGVTEPSATVHARSEASAAAATPVAIWDKQSGGAVANNRIAEWYRDTSTLLAYLEADGSDHLKLGVPSAKNITIDGGAGSGNVSLSVGGSVKITCGVTTATINNPLSCTSTLSVTGNITAGSRVLGKKGADAASGSTVTLGNGNLFAVTGTTTINHVTTTGWQAGSLVHLLFAASVTVTHNAGSPPANTAALLLAGAANFSATANDVLTLVYDGTNWVEVCRSVN
jgi:hypothetical protein